MKIVHVLYSGLGGHGSVFFSMVSANENNTFKFGAIFNGIEEIRQEYIDRCKLYSIPYLFVQKFPGKHMKFYFQLLSAIRKTNPDIIFLHGSMGIVAAYMFRLMKPGVKIIIRETQAMHLKSKTDKIAFRTGMMLADKIIFLSNEYAADIKKIMGKSYRQHKVAVIPNGIDLSLFCPVSAKPGNKLILGMQSRLVAIKDHLTLFKALTIIRNRSHSPDFHLFIAGDGSYRETLEQAVIKAELNDKITFMGMLDESRLPSFLQSLDIYIHASLGETMSTAIMQAMACALPIIASDVDGINNMITHRYNGILVPVKDQDALASAILELHSDKELLQKMSENSLSYATANFSNKVMFLRYQEVFENG